MSEQTLALIGGAICIALPIIYIVWNSPGVRLWRIDRKNDPDYVMTLWADLRRDTRMIDESAVSIYHSTIMHEIRRIMTKNHPTVIVLKPQNQGSYLQLIEMVDRTPRIPADMLTVPDPASTRGFMFDVDMAVLLVIWAHSEEVVDITIHCASMTQKVWLSKPTKVRCLHANDPRGLNASIMEVVRHMIAMLKKNDKPVSVTMPSVAISSAALPGVKDPDIGLTTLDPPSAGPGGKSQLFERTTFDHRVRVPDDDE